MKMYWGMDVHIYVYLTLAYLALYTSGKSLQYPMYRRLDRPQNWFG
jgi:hypothetical protein